MDLKLQILLERIVNQEITRSSNTLHIINQVSAIGIQVKYLFYYTSTCAHNALSTRILSQCELQR